MTSFAPNDRNSQGDFLRSAQILRFSPEIFAASSNLHSVPMQKRCLSPKIQSLISLTVSCAATHLYTPGIRSAIQSALDAGASTEEITEVIELTSTLGIHACNIGVPLLVDVMREVGGFEGHVVMKPTSELDERRLRLKEEFTKNRGYWHEFWEDFLKLDPEFFEAYVQFSSVPWTKNADGSGKPGGVLEPKVKELVYCAFDAAATHLYVPGLRLHMKNALGYGATPEEIMEVLEIATLLSLHTAETTFPILAEIVDGEHGEKGT